MQSKLRNAAARIQELDSDSEVEVVEVW
jgi:hypothetical protein